MMGNKLELRKKALALSMKGGDAPAIKKKPMPGAEGENEGGQVMMALSPEEAAMIEKMRAEQAGEESAEGDDGSGMMG